MMCALRVYIQSASETSSTLLRVLYRKQQLLLHIFNNDLKDILFFRDFSKFCINFIREFRDHHRKI